ncbi:unnamed protein product, partial [Polarella glacialis]
DWKKLDAESSKPPGMEGARAVGEDSGPMSLEQAVVAADTTQRASRDSLNRSLGMVLQAEQVGISTLQTMNEQDEQLGRIGEDVEDIKANIQRSKKLVGQIARSAASDRCIQMICVLITVAVMVMIALAATGNDGGELNVPDPVRQGGAPAPAPPQ